MIFQQILNKDSGLSTRAKLNSMLSALIQSDEGVNAVWVFLKSLEQAMQTLSSKEDNDVADLRGSLAGANDYTDKAVNKLYTYVDAMNGGVGGLIDSTSYDPSGLPTDKPCTLIALGSGTFINLKDVTDTAITVSQANSITVFFRAAHITYWSYKTEVLTAPPMDDTPINGNTTHVVSSDGVYDFVMLHGIDNVDVADVTDSAHLKDRIVYLMRKNIGTSADPEYETIGAFTIPVVTATKAGLLPAYVDGVFDVNRYVGSNTPYDSLSQILSNAATLIPTAVRRGGMSIKFIQSSDNKYVQYRLTHTLDNASTAAADFANTANWQGVDDEPTAGSNNLVKSGGTNESINDVVRSISTEITGYDTPKGRIDTNNNYDASNYRHAVIPVTAGDKFILDNLSANVRIRYIFATTNSFEDGHSMADYCVQGTDVMVLGVHSSVIVTIPEGCSYFVFNAGGNYYNPNLYKAYGNLYNPNLDDVPTIGSDNPVKSKGIQSAIVDVEKDLYVPMELTEYNYALLESGKFGSSDSNYHCVLAVAEGEKYLVKGFLYARYAFATTDEYTAGEDVPVVDGTSVTNIYDNTYYPVIIPAGCTWLLVNQGVASNDVRKYVGSVSEQIENVYINDYKEAEEIDLESIDSYSRRSGSFNPDGWKYTTGSSTSYHMIFDVFGDDCMIKVTANDNNPAYVAFVDDISCPINGTAVPFVEGTSRIKLNVGETKYLMVPKETVALLVYLGNPDTGYVYKPSALTIYRNRDTRSVDGIAVNASYMTVNEDTGVIETAYFSAVGRALKVRNGDVFYINASSASKQTKIGGFLDTLPVIDSLVAVNGNINSTNFYRQYVSDRDGWFVYFDRAIVSFSVNYQGSAKDAVVKKDEASFKNYLSTLNYKKIDLLELPLYNVSYLGNGVFGTSRYRSVFVDVREALFVKIAPNSNSTYSRIGWVTEIGTPVEGGVPSYVPSCPGAIKVDGTQVLEVPSGANYMLVYLGLPSSDYSSAPSYVGLYGNASEEGSFNSYEQLIVDFNSRRDRTLTEHSTIGLTPRIIPVDDNGWEIPESLQQLNAQKKSEQLVNIRWTPKWDVPSKSGNNYTANAEVTTGIPYSSNNDDGSKTIGEETSIHTFMTAVDNPYSLLYTECVNNGAKVPSASKPNAPSQASYWGKTYTRSSNGFAYYGTVCCGLTSSVENSPLKWNNTVIRSYTLTNGVYIPVCAPGVVDFNLIKIGDICDNMSHSFMVYGLHRDSNGEIDQVKYVESTSGYGKGGCRIVTKTRQAFAEHVNKLGNPFTVFRYVKLWDNTDYEASEYVPLTARGESATAVTYNNAICTFAGDKCTFRVGDLIVINYNLYGTQAHDWTKIQVYKDNVLLNEYTLAEAEQTLTNYLIDYEVTPNPFNPAIDEHNHALVLGTELTQGMYKACMVDADGNASDYTYWEVLDNAVTSVELGKDEYEVTVSGTHLIQVIYVNSGMYYLPTYEEQQTRKFIVRPAALAELFGKTYEGYEVSVKLAGVYGNVTTVPVKLYGGDVTPDEEPDDDND